MQKKRQTISVFYSANCRIFLPSIYSVQIDILQKKKNKTLTLNLFVSHAYALNTSASKSTEAVSLMYYEKKDDLFGTFSRTSRVSLSSRR